MGAPFIPVSQSPVNVVRCPAQSLLLGQLGPNDRCGEEAQRNPPLHCSFVDLDLLSWVRNQVPLDTNYVGAVHRCPGKQPSLIGFFDQIEKLRGRK